MAGERVLIVDDNQFNTKLASHLLTADGFDVCTAETADDVTAAFASGRPQLILMDLHLRGIDGLTLTRSLRSQPENGDILIIAFTSDLTHRDGQRLLDAGCDGYIEKPIDVSQFCSVVRRYLASKRSRRASYPPATRVRPIRRERSRALYPGGNDFALGGAWHDAMTCVSPRDLHDLRIPALAMGNQRGRAPY